MTALTIALNPEHLNRLGIPTGNNIHYQLPPAEVVQDTLRTGEGKLADTGALVIHTGTFTGRSPKDKYIVRDPVSDERVNWGDINIPLEETYFRRIYNTVTEYVGTLPEIWVRDGYACADKTYRMNIRTISEKPWTDLFAYNMFIRPTEYDLAGFSPEWTIICVPGLKLDPEYCGIRNSNAAVISFSKKMILIAGTGYTGETKKGIFSVLNFILPLQHNVLSMHCAANMCRNEETALFFGLSGTGKTTLSADPERYLIGDDEHGWSDHGIFNFEGGCYAKTIDLSQEKEPQIYQAIREGALLENTNFYPGTNTVDYSDKSITENTRVSYPIHYIQNAVNPSIGKIPKNIFFLTCDAHGVLPPISRLSIDQALYHFISGYTAKVAGTEDGITEPKSTFSACFGAPFLPLHPGVYARMLGEKLALYGSTVWLVNTGWTGGAFGEGHRISLAYTRAMVKAALEGKLDTVSYSLHRQFGLQMPDECPGVPSEILHPRNTWSNEQAYEEKAHFLAGLFRSNFKKFEAEVDPRIIAAGPLP